MKKFIEKSEIDSLEDISRIRIFRKTKRGIRIDDDFYLVEGSGKNSIWKSAQSLNPDKTFNNKELADELNWYANEINEMKQEFAIQCVRSEKLKMLKGLNVRAMF